MTGNNFDIITNDPIADVRQIIAETSGGMLFSY